MLGRGVGVLTFLGWSKVKIQLLSFDDIFCVRGFDRGDKKGENPEISPSAAYFWCLWACGGVSGVWVLVIWGLKSVILKWDDHLLWYVD